MAKIYDNPIEQQYGFKYTERVVADDRTEVQSLADLTTLIVPPHFVTFVRDVLDENGLPTPFQWNGLDQTNLANWINPLANLKQRTTDLENETAALTSGVRYAIPQAGNTPATEPAATENGIYRVKVINATYPSFGGIVVPNDAGFIYDIQVSGIGVSPVYTLLSTDVNITIDATVIDGSNNAVSGNAVFDALALKAPINNPTFTGTVAGITKTMVGLGNVDNTTDLNKPVSTAQQAALDLKASLIVGKNIFNKDAEIKTFVAAEESQIDTFGNKILRTCLTTGFSFATFKLFYNSGISLSPPVYLTAETPNAKSNQPGDANNRILYFNTDNRIIKSESATTLATYYVEPTNGTFSYVRFSYATVNEATLQIELGSTSTGFEPYKLSVNEDELPSPTGEINSTEKKGISGQTAYEFLQTNKENVISNFPFTRGTFNFTTGVLTPNETDSRRYTQLQTLENVEKIEYLAATFNSGQPNIYFLREEENGTFTTVSSLYNLGATEILKASFPATSTHYVVSGIDSLSPETFYNKNYKFVQNIVLSNLTQTQSNEEAIQENALAIAKNTKYVTDTLDENLDNYIKVSILDPTTWLTNTQISDTTGVASELINAAANVSDYAEIQLNTEYSIGFSTRVWMYGFNREYLGFIAPTDNTTFTITNPLCYEIRVSAPSVGSLCVIKKYIITTPAGVFRPPYTGLKYQTFNNLYKYPIQGFGDSIISFSIGAAITDVTGRNCSMFSYGGRQSPLIRSQFIQLANIEGCISFIYVGHNNIQETKTILNDIRMMVDHLGHERYIIASTPCGTYTNLAGTEVVIDQTILLENKLKEIYGNHYINARQTVIDDYGWQVKLTQDFTQPPADGTTTVDIYVDNVPFMMFRNANDNLAFIPDQDLFRLSMQDASGNTIYDEYEIISSTIVSGDSGYLTCKLVPAGSYRVAIGNIVGNYDLSEIPSGGSTPIDFIKYVQVDKTADLYLASIGTTPSTARVDAVHPSYYGAEIVAKAVARKLNTMNF